MTEKAEKNGKNTFSPENLNPKKVRKALKDFPLSIPRETEDQSPKPRLYQGACKVCGGDVTEKIVREFNPMTGPPIIGPGSKQQYHYVSEGLYCKRCGIKYEFIPKEDQEKKQ